MKLGKNCNNRVKQEKTEILAIIKNHRTNTRLVCTHLNAFFMPIPNIRKENFNAFKFCEKS